MSTSQTTMNSSVKLDNTMLNLKDTKFLILNEGGFVENLQHLPVSQGTIKPCRDTNFHAMLKVAKLSFKIDALYFLVI